MITKLSIKSQIALGCGYSLGLIAFIMAPLLVGVFISEYTFSEISAGWIVLSEFGMLAIASIAFAPRIDKLPKRQLCLIGVAVFVIGNLITLFSKDLGMILLARGITGFAAGLLLTSVSTIAAETDLPEKTYASMLIISALFGGVLFALVPFVFEVWGERNVFWLFIVMALTLSPAISLLPDSMFVQRANLEKISINTFALILFAGVTLITISDVGIWVYVDVKAHQSEIPIEQRSTIYLTVALAVTVAPAIAYGLGRRIGFFLPLAGATVVMSVAGLTTLIADSVFPLAFGVISMASAYSFALPFAFGICAIEDPTGRLAGALPGFQGIAQAIGPPLGGLMLGLIGNFSVLGFIFAAMFIFGGSLLCLSTRIVSVQTKLLPKTESL